MNVEPCPFCGMHSVSGRAIASEYVKLEPVDIDGALHVCMDGNGWYWVQCTNCGTTGPRYHGRDFGSGNQGPVNHSRDRDKTAKAVETAVEAWNQRDGRLF